MRKIYNYLFSLDTAQYMYHNHILFSATTMRLMHGASRGRKPLTLKIMSKITFESHSLEEFLPIALATGTFLRLPQNHLVVGSFWS